MRWRSSRLVWTTVTLAALVAPPAAAEIRVGGMVRDRGEPAAGLAVALLPVGGEYEVGRRRLAGDALPAPLATALTRSDGAFELAAPGPGMYRLRLEAPAAVPLEVPLEPLVEELALPAVELTADAGLRVRVTGPDGAPVAGAWVHVTPEPASRSQPFTELPAWRLAPRFARTGEDGWARLPRRAGEAPEVAAWAVGHLPAARERVRTPALELALAAGVPRRLDLRDERGRPAAGVLVSYRDGDWPLGVTDEAGELDWQGPGGEVEIVLRAADGRRHRVRRPPPPAGGAATAVVEVLPEGTTDAGLVLDAASREAVPGAVVWQVGDAGGWVASDGRGGYALPAAGGDLDRQLMVAATGYQLSWSLVAPGQAAPTLALFPAAAVAGSVVDAEGSPLAGVEVTVQVAGRPRWGSPRWALQRVPRTTASGRGGRFAVAGLDPGLRYRMRASAEGFAPTELDLEGLEPYATRDGLTVVLGRGRMGWGRVLDTADRPVTGAEVTLTPSRAAQRSFFGKEAEPAHHAATGAGGRFEIAGLAAGSFRLEASAAGFAPAVVPGIEVPDGDGAFELGSVLLEPGVAVEGRVVDGDGRPLAGVEVRAWISDPMYRFHAAMSRAGEPPDALSAADGWFAVPDRSAGETVDLGLDAAGFAPALVPGIEAPTEEPVEVVLEPLARLAGRLVDPDGAPIAEGRVSGTLIRRAGDANQHQSYSQLSAGPAQSDEKGRWALEGVEPGIVELLAVAPGRQSGTLGELEVAAGEDRDDLELVLEPAATVSGRVLGPGGEPAVGARVDRVRDPADRSPRVTLATTDGDGRYWLDGVGAGVQSFRALHEGSPAAVRELEVEAGDNRLDFQLEGGVEVAGRVIDAAGAPVAGATLWLVPDGSWRRHQATSGGDGAFSFRGVADGHYRLRVLHEGFFLLSADDATVEVAGVPPAFLEVVLDRGGVISGRLLGVDFGELARIEVTVTGAGWTRGEVRHDGRYRITGVGPGVWQVRAEIPGSGRRAQGTATLEAAEEVPLDLDFGTGWTLSGRVLSGEEPVAGVTVSVSGMDVNSGGSALTDRRGGFRVEGLESGRYQVAVEGPGGPAHDEELEIDGDREVILPYATGRVRGRVVDAGDGAPLAGTQVVLEPPADGGHRGRAGEARTDAAGRFTLYGVPAGRHRVSAQKAGYARASAAVEVGGSAPEDGVELALQATEGLVLVVTSPTGRPVESAQVAVLAGARPLLSEGYSGAEGRLRLSTVPAGRWTALVAASGAAVAEVTVTVPGPPVAVTLAAGGILEVTVPELVGTPHAATLTLAGPDGRAFRTPSWGGRVNDEWRLWQGRTTVRGLPPGAWTARVEGGDGRVWQGSVVVAASGRGELTLE